MLYGSGVYLLLRRNLLKFILALGLISNATHLLIFTAAGLTRGIAPLIPAEASRLEPPYADPLPQALILTAIVISFGLTAFTVLLVHRVHRATDTDDPDALTTTDRMEPHRSPPLPPLSIPRPPAAAREEKSSNKAIASTPKRSSDPAIDTKEAAR